MALLALALASVKDHPRWTVAMTMIGVVGLFSTMYRNARDSADYLQLPPNRVIELGSQIVI